jgi:hypothetical protein
MKYLQLISGALITDMLVMISYMYAHSFGFFSSTLSKWYKSFGLGAVLSDVTVIVLCVIISKFIYPFIFSKYNILYLIGLAVSIQIIHDLIFGYVISYIDTGKSPIFNIFKSYVKIGGYYIIFVDSLMIISTILIMNYLENLSEDTNIFIFILSLYLLCYILYSF